MKIAIVEPRSVDYNIYSHVVNPLLGPVYLGTILRDNGHQVSIINENLTPAMGKDNRFLEEISQADILMMSGITPTIPRAYELCSEFKKQFPGKRIIIGGSHVSFAPEEAKKYADVVVVGEAEDVIEEALKTRKKILHGRPVENLDSLPLPDLSLIKNSKFTCTPVMTSRGCPFACKFCSVTKMFGRRYRFRSADNVLNELRQYDRPEVFFYDDNFTANTERSKELLTRMHKEDLVKAWSSQTRVDVVRDQKLLSLMAKTNCWMTYIGFESINEKTLKLYNKGQNLKDIKRSVKKLHDNGIAVHGMFVLGSDEDDKKTIAKTAEFCDHNEIDTTQFLILTPMVGTETYEELKNRIFTRNWKFYDGLHVVYKPKLMNPLELQLAMLDAMKEFYSFSKGLRLAVRNSIEYGMKSIRNWVAEKKSQLPNFKSPTFKMFGSSIIKKWERRNTHYMEELARITEKIRKRMPDRPLIRLPNVTRSSI